MSDSTTTTTQIIALIKASSYQQMRVEEVIGSRDDSPPCFCGWGCMYGHKYSNSMDQPGKVANPARGQLNRENEYFPVRVRA